MGLCKRVRLDVDDPEGVMGSLLEAECGVCDGDGVDVFRGIEELVVDRSGDWAGAGVPGSN